MGRRVLALAALAAAGCSGSMLAGAAEAPAVPATGAPCRKAPGAVGFTVGLVACCRRDPRQATRFRCE